MPASNPEIGEVWELSTPDADNAAQAVVTSVTPLHIRLVSRLRRIVNVPRRSFELTWTFRRPAQDHLCSHRTAPVPDGLLLEHPGYLQAQDSEGVWGWFCEEHCPTTTPLFPDDTPLNRAPASLSRCPICGMSTTHPSTWASKVAGFDIHCCGGCHFIWSVLITRGSVDDGHLLAEQIIELADALQGLVSSTAARIRSDTLRVINRAVGGTRSWANGSHINGVRVESVETHEAGSGVVVFGHAVADIRDGLDQEARSEATDIILPRPGDVWFHRLSGEAHLVTGVSSGVIDLKDQPSMTPTEFARTYLLKPFDLGFDESAELLDANKVLWAVTQIDRHRWQVILAGPNGPKTIGFNAAVSEFRVIRRRSVYARLLADDDPFKDSSAEG